MSLQKPPNPMNQRSNSNGRNKAYNRQLRPAQPKWLSKEYQPVFKAPGSGDSKTLDIAPKNSEFSSLAGKSQHLPATRPDIVTLSNA